VHTPAELDQAIRPGDPVDVLAQEASLDRGERLAGRILERDHRGLAAAGADLDVAGAQGAARAEAYEVGAHGDAA
jgi:hypothetical protein